MLIAVIPGDGIGPEIMSASLEVLSSIGFFPEYVYLSVGLDKWKRENIAISEDDLDVLKRADAILKAPITTPPSMRNSFSSVTLTIRKELELYANIRPLQSFPISPFKDINIVIIRENTEGLYSGVETFNGKTATTKRIITKKASERIVNFAFQYALNNWRKKITCVHKANIMKMTCGLFKEVFLEVAEKYPEINSDELLVDNCAFQMVSNPENLDVLLTTNMFGDILSDLGAALIGSLGLLGSINIGEKSILFEPVHGTAPDIVGKNIANPTGMIIASTYMLDFFGVKKGEKIRKTINKLFGNRLDLTKDLGGKATTKDFVRTLINLMDN
jgi:isopropylmalate/isohomocitrate dehydrogenase-like protein